MSPTDTNEKSNNDMVVDTIMEVLVEKNPMFAVEEQQNREKISMQYQTFLMTALMQSLEEAKQTEFENMLLEQPLNRDMHNEFLMKNVDDFENKILDFTEDFVTSYIKAIDEMPS